MALPMSAATRSAADAQAGDIRSHNMKLWTMPSSRRRVVGTPALDAYQSVPPIDVSRHLRHGARSTVTFSLVDFGGFYANSELWLVTNCTASRRVDICHKPGTSAEHVITVNQSAVSGHLGHGDSTDLSACRPFERPMR